MWYSFELQNSYMNLFLELDWKNLSKPGAFDCSTISLLNHNVPTGVPSTLLRPAPTVLLHSFNSPIRSRPRLIPVLQHLFLQAH
jgi:hypothetical protein